MWFCLSGSTCFWRFFNDIDEVLVLFTAIFCAFRYLKEDKPHGSAGSLYYFRDKIMEESPVCISGYWLYLLNCLIDNLLLLSFAFWLPNAPALPSYYHKWNAMLWFLQSHIFLLNFDVCCNFPLPDMLGDHRLFFWLDEYFWSYVCYHNVICTIVWLHFLLLSRGP